jgi:hypothetical protein
MNQETANQTAAEPLLLRCLGKDGKIVCERSPREIGAIVSEGRIVILKSAFDPESIRKYRDALMCWSKEAEMFPHGKSPSAFPDLNYHRIDDGAIQGVCPHIFHQFGFNTIEQLPEYVGRPSMQIAEAMRTLQNEVAGTNFSLSLTGVRLKVIHYPSGAGFLAQHTHPLEPQRIGLIASLSRLGQDVKSGAACFHTPFGRVDTTHDHDIGDIIIFRYDLPHEVTVSNQGESLDWKSPAGKWSVVLELRETHGKSHGQPAARGV